MKTSCLVAFAVMAVANAADYSGALRPQVHFSPPKDFMNDPNGLFFDDRKGIYHLYYQCMPSLPSCESPYCQSDSPR